MKIGILVLSLFGLFLIGGCSEDKSSNNQSCSPKITSISPDFGKIDDEITVYGECFGDELESNYVSFNGAKATFYTLWSNNVIKLKIPAGSSSGMVSLVVNGNWSNEIKFTLIAGLPGITKIEPSYFRIGDSITVYGYNFVRPQSERFVSFNNVKATEYISWRDSLIIVRVPQGASDGKLYVAVAEDISNQVDFSIESPDNYESVAIGTQIWMKKNLDVERYRNGDPIPQVSDPQQWSKLKTGGWCYYGNDSPTGAVYGKLYNSYAIRDPRGLAPRGWHVATDIDWVTLITFLGEDSIAGGKLKETGTAHWFSPNAGASNSSDFTALPGGIRNEGGNFIDAGRNAYFWSSQSKGQPTAWSRNISYSGQKIIRADINIVRGYSVRCLRY